MKKICIIAVLLCLFITACSVNNQVTDESATASNTIISDTAETTSTGSETNGSFISENITIGAGTEWELAGILTLPENADGKVPAVVLVQGSGPSDMDETIYENKPFREIAEYLSSNGIAVIRYNKTYIYLWREDGAAVRRQPDCLGRNDGRRNIGDRNIKIRPAY